jgi:zinc protease
VTGGLRMISVASVLLCACIATAAARAATGAVESPPAPAAPRDFALPPTERLALDNGLEATLVDVGLVPQVTLVAVVAAGNIDESDMTWLADLVGDSLEQGAGERDAAQFARATAELGGELGVSVGPDQTTLSLTVLSEHAAEGVALLADVLRRPRLPEAELPRLKADRARALAIAASDPGTLADQAFMRMLYGEHPYGRLLPTPQQLQALTHAEVTRFHRANFVAGRTRLYVAGRFDRGAVEAAIRALLGDWERGGTIARPAPDAGSAPRRQLLAFPGAPQSVVRLGLRVPGPRDPDYIAFSVANALLGGGLPSRITSNLRERHGYAYSPSTAAAAQLLGSHWALDAEVTTANTADALREAFGEIRRLQDEPPPAAELAGMQNFRAGLFVIRNASPQGLIGQLAFRDLYGLPDDFLTQQVARIRAVSPAQVSDVLRRWLPLGGMSLVVVGEQGAVAEAVRALPEVAALRDVE